MVKETTETEEVRMEPNEAQLICNLIERLRLTKAKSTRRRNQLRAQDKTIRLLQTDIENLHRKAHRESELLRSLKLLQQQIRDEQRIRRNAEDELYNAKTTILELERKLLPPIRSGNI